MMWDSMSEHMGPLIAVVGVLFTVAGAIIVWLLKTVYKGIHEDLVIHEERIRCIERNYNTRFNEIVNGIGEMRLSIEQELGKIKASIAGKHAE